MDTAYVLFGEVSHPPKFQVKNAFCAFLGTNETFGDGRNHRGLASDTFPMDFLR